MVVKPKSVLFLFTSLVLLFSCKTENVKMKTSSGYDYIHHIINETATPNVGDYVFFEMQVFGDTGQLIQNLRDLPNMPSFQILDPSAPHYRLNPINEMMSEMSIGDSASLFYPIDSLPSIPPEFKDNEKITYAIVIRDIKDKETHLADMKIENDKRQVEIEQIKSLEPEKIEQAKAYLDAYLNNEFEDEVMTTNTGLKFIIHEPGNGEVAKEGNRISVNYVVLLMDGTPVDNSFKQGKTYLFDLGITQVVEGWHEAFSFLDKESKTSLIVPYELAYGVAGRPGSVPEKADLFFYLEYDNFYMY